MAHKVDFLKLTLHMLREHEDEGFGHGDTQGYCRNHLHLDWVISELAKAINEFWLELIDEPIWFEKLKPSYGVKERSIENLEIVCNHGFVQPTWR